ncbi:nuclear intron maturase 3, mitochondrial-like [Selaginella moellendorffii]|uniref:nuclear intron maturase 3, mitochondrial-like n=1 Tax=Selaginella moellendorffii TaxID=88036 RepID=UPI000D1CA0B7|nr:nuclear intron maturase 3, mitochondrial-like [Selaginella moellendorffii]|eukprot:XP_024541953.1 nuclear intron maturase 3, mitochondrial-like [Selaginella moellendorffii]
MLQRAGRAAPWRRCWVGASAAPHRSAWSAAAAVEEEPSNRALIAREVNSLFQDVDQERFRQGVDGIFVDGKYRLLMRNVVATPSNLMAAYNSIKKRSGPLLGNEAKQMEADGISREVIEHMSRDLAIGTFDVKANCVEVLVSSKENSTRSLVLPNLKTKIAMEATRMALQEVYEPRFSSLSFASRPGRGRHMAMRLIKYRWKYFDWFIKMKLERHFTLENFDVLVAILEETIEDSRLIAFLRQLFRARVFQMDMGNLHWEDFCKEPILSPMLLNIYLDKLDWKIQEVAEGVASMNPEEPEEVKVARASVPDADIGITEESAPNTPAEESDDPADRKIRLYACRYGDEVLLAVSGQKEIALTVQHELCVYVNEKLVAEVERGRKTLMDATLNQCDFLGFQLQFVPPSKMPEFRKQTCIQSMRAVENRIEMVKRQMKHHYDAVVRKLGAEMLVEIYTRSRKNASSESQGDATVRRMFESVAGDMVRGFLSSEREEERLMIREKFRKGHILMSPWIREQLPKELIAAFDRFQEEVDKFLGQLDYSVSAEGGVNARLKQKQEKMERLAAEKEARSTGNPPPIKVKKADELRLLVIMPIMELVDKLRLREIVTKGGRPTHFRMLLAQEDIAILHWYSGLAYRWLDYYRCCDNFAFVKKTVDYHLRWSLIFSLAAKHKSSSRNIRKSFSNDIKVVGLDGNLASFFPTESDLRNMGKKFLVPPLVSHDTKCGDNLLFVVLTRMSRQFLRGKCCSVIGCYSGMIDMYLMRVHKVLKRIQVSGEEWMEVVRVGTLHSVYDWKSFPLCFEHYLEMMAGRVSVASLRAEALVAPQGITRRRKHSRRIPFGMLTPPLDKSADYE